MRGKAEPAAADGPPTMVSAPRLALTEATRRWATLLQQICEVDPLACPSGHGVMRLVACITPPSVIDQILAHLRTGVEAAAHGAARSPPSTRGPSGPGATRRPAAAHRGVRSVPVATGRPRQAPFGRPPRRAGRRVIGDCAVGSPDTRPTPIEFRILKRAYLFRLRLAFASSQQAFRESKS